MPCYTQPLKPKQTLLERQEEIRRAVTAIGTKLASGRLKAVVGKLGGIAFDGLTAADRDGLTDICIYRKIMASGLTGAKLAIMKAEQLAGRPVDKKMLAAGLHSHDGGQTWGTH